MNKLVSRLRKIWFMLALVGSSLAIALPGQAGKAPVGLTSGITIGGTTFVPAGSPTLGTGTQVGSNSPNANVDPGTGQITLTAAAQQSLNQAALALLQALQNTSPGIVNILINLLANIDLQGFSPVGATFNGGGTTVTIGELALLALNALNNGESISITTTLGTLTIAAPTPAPGASLGRVVASANRGVVSDLPFLNLAQANLGDDEAVWVTSAVFVPEGGTPVVTPLQGTREQIANAGSFLAASFAAGLTPDQVDAFTEMALAGIDYADLVTLLNATNNLLPAQEINGSAVDATQLESAIQAYNRILDNTDPDILVALDESHDFMVLGRSLQQLRASIDL
ncbi:hypothetical protein IQ254_01815 [Nodosilinea sp. LEGE 07088]|uniref:hypothetical protein n=1 Tax=Nodosilinea sp. LEGE 07088 TaxID=2777968 RepID=UPI00187E4007|nr:hypothetical protein [Nodosilinea sp. LEGE 07088]MBE9135952.1 hypothetical protein [Nodosilinea sp. LEGE 07088]